jgi:hypothetical protein
MSIPPEIEAYLKGPSCPAPEGVSSNLDNPSNSNGEAFFLAVLCIVLVATTALARAYSRICIVKEHHIEDCMSPLSSSLSLAILTHRVFPDLGIGAIVCFGGPAHFDPCSDFKRIPFSGIVWSYLYFAQHVGFFVQQWDLPGSVIIDFGYVRS